ncbi:MAG: AAA family ATPase [Candidatus Heimdallarchaeota archaeon]
MVIATVADGFQDDYAKNIGRISQKRFDDFDIKEGEVVEVVSGDRKVGILLKPLEEINVPSQLPEVPLYPAPQRSIRQTGDLILHLNGFLRANLGVGIGQKVFLDKTACPEAKKVLISTYSMEDKDKVFIEYLLDRPVIRGQTIELRRLLGGRDLKVAILSTTPSGIVRIVPETDVRISNEIPKELVEDELDRFVMWDEVGGHSELISRLRNLVELPLRYPEVFEMLNIQPAQGILLTGPLGVGKSHLSRALSCESGVTRFFIMATEMIRGWWTTEKDMNKYFQHIINYEPAVIVIDQIEALAPAPSRHLSDLERRTTTSLIQNLDKIIRGRKVIVIATTTDADSVHPALRVPGRFEIEIAVPIPNYRDRLEILKTHVRGIPTKELDLEDIAKNTGGYTPADLEFLIKMAGMHALERQNLLDPEINQVSGEESDNNPKSHGIEIHLSQEDLFTALTEVKPSATREITTSIPLVSWNDVGGLEDVKQSLREMVEWPIRSPEVFHEMNIRLPRGALLYGPPGTGKTLIAKALASEIQANFLVVRGPELLSKWFSESARMVRELFQRARQLAPCIIFFDELDALAGKRGGGFTNASRERDRIINQLLASLDGMEKLTGVYVIGATNRPNAIDPALLRPGRLDRLIYVPIPDMENRLKIFEVHTRHMELDETVDLKELARSTENFTGADIENLCREAAFAGLRRDFTSRSLSFEDFNIAMDKCRPSINENIVKYFEVEVEAMKKHRISDYSNEERTFV